MSTAFVLMTAMPPTKGHLHLIQFASHVTDETCVIIGTQPSEPYVQERIAAISRAAQTMAGVRVVNIHKTLPQTPDGNQVFLQNCARCHTVPESFSPRIAGTVIRHMRVRAGLSAQDEKALLRFLNQ